MFSVANAVVVVGVTKALLVGLFGRRKYFIQLISLCFYPGLLSKDKCQEDSEDDLYSLISSTTDLNISDNKPESCIDLRRPIVQSDLINSASSSESDSSLKTLPGSESLSNRSPHTDINEEDGVSRRQNKNQEISNHSDFHKRRSVQAEIETVTEKEKPRCIETNFIECENGEILTDL